MLFAVLTSVAALSSPLVPPSQAAPNPPTASVSAPVCHNEAVTGSRIGVFHVCMSQREWDARAAIAHGFLLRFQNRSAIQR